MELVTACNTDSSMEIASVYQLLIENAMDAFFIAGPNGSILEANRAACDMFGYTEEEMKRIGWDKIIDYTAETLERLRAERKRTGKIKGELTGIRKNGKYFPVSFSSVILSGTSDEDQVVSVVIRDITERKQLEAELHANEQRFRALVENSMDMIMQVNAEREITYVSPATCRIMGMDAAELTGKRMKDLMHEEDVQRLLPGFERFLSEPGTTISSEYRVKIKDGSYLWVEGSVTNLLHLKGLESLVINQRDISEKKQREQELLKSNERFHYAAKATNDAIWDWDVESGTILRIGDGLKNLFGYDPVVASANPNFWTDSIHPDDLSRVLEKRNKVLYHSPNLYWDDEYRVVKADGKYAYIYDKGYIIRNPEGKPIRVIGATQNVSPRREAEALLLELNNRLKRRAEELAASNIELERFAYVASHDLQEPLRMVSSFLQLFKKKYHNQIDETADQYIHFAIDGAERMRKLILDLLEYSRVGSNREGFEETDLNKLLSEMVAFFNRLISDTGAVINIGPMPEIWANRTQISQLFQNLVGNAIKYSGDKTPEISISYTDEPEKYIFHVQDNGIGIDPVNFNKIFVIFQRLHSKRDYSGTGIGLAICKKIVEKHGGTIWVESEPGKGSRFSFSISKTL
ncbi:PAS domain S-box-containing protein [Sediminibacterium ginsengisoli]|uniref:histidine kinase n=2 Tax=Sediminibacterium ginsengisoli TaxID=413434 RepID=A0A1T4RGR9_9BACT|nr:PAS domain S-box-containing protein [Sediminibacterium ginsengisoli]